MKLHIALVFVGRPHGPHGSHGPHGPDLPDRPDQPDQPDRVLLAATAGRVELQQILVELLSA
jgi:hypothetical protein